MSIARAAALTSLALLALAACGDDEEKSEEDRAADVAKRYVHSASNNERENCRETLASGVNPELCGDLEPLVARNDPERRKVRITGSTAVATVTGAGPALLDIELVNQGDEWRVKSWKGYAPGQEPHGGPGGTSGDGY
jgi:hypothetical protein